jgi:hypothetical protein
VALFGILLDKCHFQRSDGRKLGSAAAFLYRGSSFESGAMLMSAILSPISRFLGGWIIAIAAVAITLLMDRAAEAVPLTIVDPIYEADQSPAPPHASAGSTAHIFENSITLANAAYFQAAWDEWNFRNAVDYQWTLVDGGSLADLGLTVTTFDAASDHNDNHNPDTGAGGVEILVSIDYSGADRNQLIWSQGLYVNYKLNYGGAYIVVPYYDMDYKQDPNASQPPAYPYQYPDQHFYDFPAGPFDNAFFEADAFLSKVNYTTRTLTIYDGVEYGFFLHVEPVPEPAAWMLMSIGLALGAIVVHRRHHNSPSTI